MSAVRDCLFNIFAATLHIWRPFLYPQPDNAPCRGNRNPLITAVQIYTSDKVLQLYRHVTPGSHEHCSFFGDEPAQNTSDTTRAAQSRGTWRNKTQHHCPCGRDKVSSVVSNYRQLLFQGMTQHVRCLSNSHSLVKLLGSATCLRSKSEIRNETSTQPHCLLCSSILDRRSAAAGRQFPHPQRTQLRHKITVLYRFDVLFS